MYFKFSYNYRIVLKTRYPWTSGDIIVLFLMFISTDAAFDFFFIDGNDNEVENTWVFSDGTQLSFLPFEGSEPNRRETENCLLFLAEKYYDASCYNYIAKFICEKKIG